MRWSGWGTFTQRTLHNIEKMKKIKLSLILLLLLVSGGCGVSVKLDGFREIAERHPLGMEQVTENSESQALVIELGKYINELERRIEAE